MSLGRPRRKAAQVPSWPNLAWWRPSRGASPFFASGHETAPRPSAAAKAPGGPERSGGGAQRLAFVDMGTALAGSRKIMSGRRGTEGPYLTNLADPPGATNRRRVERRTLGRDRRTVDSAIVCQPTRTSRRLTSPRGTPLGRTTAGRYWGSLDANGLRGSRAFPHGGLSLAPGRDRRRTRADHRPTARWSKGCSSRFAVLAIGPAQPRLPYEEAARPGRTAIQCWDPRVRQSRLELWIKLRVATLARHPGTPKACGRSCTPPRSPSPPEPPRPHAAPSRASSPGTHHQPTPAHEKTMPTGGRRSKPSARFWSGGGTPFAAPRAAVPTGGRRSKPSPCFQPKKGAWSGGGTRFAALRAAVPTGRPAFPPRYRIVGTG